ncbi:MAG: ATP synthase F1 subunit gamma [bacterium]|nr:ATP synthase F1 subunit gamma [Candidatus Microgenomates bacterium CPR3]MCQ3944333.1 ATP synthase F1 subunit gamma [bacterium]RIK51480.1 MAG: ATP synthase F1 subunit gamma [Candidatus Microgenomates bacterium]
MASLIGIRRRIKSAKNIAQITKAMEMVSASKMKKAQDAALATRPFTLKLKEMMDKVSGGLKGSTHPLTLNSKNPNILVILISTNKGLCGALNVNLYRSLLEFAGNHVGSKIMIATVGKKAKYITPTGNTELSAKFNNLGETVTFAETRSVSAYAIEQYSQGVVGKVYLAYPRFISTLQNDITFTKILPFSTDSTDSVSNYTIEPSSTELLDTLLPYQIEMSVYQTILEARATEHSARMVAMKNASDNAKELIGNLTLDYNQARQSSVTNELLDVTTARMAIE